MYRIALVAVTSLLAAAPSAAADATATATPARAGQPSTLHFDINGLAPPISGRLPKSLQLSAPPGFKVNLNAIAQRCSEETAKLNECPRGTQFGKGKLIVGVTQQGKASRDVTIPLTVFLHSSNSLLAVAKVFGWQVVPATLNTRNGLLVRFDPLPAGPPFAGVSYTLKRITIDLGASRVIKKGKRRTKVTLLRNPSRCGGSWLSSVALTFRDGTPTQQIPTPMACSK